MSELQACYDSARSGIWQDEDPASCGCRGSGYFLSQVDTVHKCHFHGDGAVHPEDDEPNYNTECFALYKLDAGRKFFFEVRTNKVTITEERWNWRDGEWDEINHWTPVFRPEARQRYLELIHVHGFRKRD